MFKKINSTTLLIILIVLAGVVALNKFYLSKRSESTFNDEFVRIDSTKISQILIYPKAAQGEEINITRQGKGWELRDKKLKTNADPAAIDNLIKSFVLIKSNALAANDKSSWKEFQIDDSTGSRIKIITSDNKTYDMVVGKFGYNQATRNGISYIRRANEEPVYAVDGFLSFAVNKPISFWRNRTFITGNKDSWNTLTYTYPGDHSFVLAKQNNVWTVNGQPADSVKMVQYLNALASMQISSFVDPYTPTSSPVYSLTIKGDNQSAPITVTAYPADSVQKFVLHSSLNNDAYFSDGNSQVAERVFVPRENFLGGTK